MEFNSQTPSRFLRNILIKTLILFLVLNFIPSLLDIGSLGRLSAYNVLFPGRERFPFGENPQKAYNLSLNNLDAMFHSLRLDGVGVPDQEFRVIVIGDSSVWGSLLNPAESLPGQLDQMDMVACDGRPVRVYNLGYPTLSLTKDLMILDEVLRYEPDLIVWMTTLEAFPIDQQFVSPLVAGNPQRAAALIAEYNLPFDPSDGALDPSTRWESTLIGQRRELADLLRLQLFGVLWAATGIDQEYPETYPAAMRDFEAGDIDYHGFQGMVLPERSLAFSVLEAGIAQAGAPVLVVNEPVMVSRGENSDLRYNFYYPRWAYDQYRDFMKERSNAGGWSYIDLWNLVDESEFTNSAIHLTPAGTSRLAIKIAEALQEEYCP